MQKQFSDSNKIIKDVTTELEKIKGTNEKVLSFANQMKTLEKILGNQKSRGIFGEIQLENLCLMSFLLIFFRCNIHSAMVVWLML